MIQATTTGVLATTFGPRKGIALIAKQTLLMIAGIATLAISAKISVPMWPVPITMGTFAVLAIASGYGARLGLATIFGYLVIGALGFDVFAGSSAEKFGLSYMMGSTGGYLVGFVLATCVMGQLAARGWDRSVGWMALAMLIGNVVIYVPGLIWLGSLYGWDKPILAWGLTPFLIGDAIKLALAAVLLPGLWKIVGRTQS